MRLEILGTRTWIFANRGERTAILLDEKVMEQLCDAYDMGEEVPDGRWLAQVDGKWVAVITDGGLLIRDDFHTEKCAIKWLFGDEDESTDADMIHEEDLRDFRHSMAAEGRAIS